MSEAPFDKLAAHRWFAVELNNATWDGAFAYDALARAHAAAGENKQASIVQAKARELGNKIADKDDKAFFDKWHGAGNWHGLGSK
ncbi:MAG: hypothetical protein ABI614_26900 [Planctomycetota bacterium]